MFGTPAFSTACDHLQALRAVQGQRLLAEDHLAGLGGGDGDLARACCSGRQMSTEVDVLAGDQLAPVRLDGLVAPLGGEGLGLGLVEVADRLEDGLVFEVEEVADLAIGVGVRAAHEAAADESDIEFFHKSECEVISELVTVIICAPSFSDSRLEFKL